MAEIGADVGIAASAIYWHFPSKHALLVALFDQCLDRIQDEQTAALERLGDSWDAVLEVARLQIVFAVRERDVARVYYREAHHLPERDLIRLRAKQRAYVHAWSALLRRRRPELDAAGAESLVHAAIGAIQSCLVYRSPMPPADLEAVLSTIAAAVLAAPVEPGTA
jgi:AcrR family transcriptional regulator